MEKFNRKVDTTKPLAVRADLDYKKMEKTLIILSILFLAMSVMFAIMLKDLWWIGLIVFGFFLIVLGLVYLFVRSVKRENQLPKKAIVFDGLKTLAICTDDGNFKINVDDITSITAKETNLFFVHMDCGTITIKTIHMNFKLKYIAKAMYTADYLNFVVARNKG